MRDTDFFKFVYFNVSSILTATVILLLIAVVILGLKHRRRLAELDPVEPVDRMDASIDSDDQAALREVGLSSAGLGNVYQSGSNSENDESQRE